MNELYEFVKGVGVPAVIALYVIVRVNATLRANTEALFALAVAVAQLSTRRRRHDDTS